MTMPLDPTTACCADAYSRDIVALILGESYHPGGAALTRQLADQLQLSTDARVADIACGRGTTARLLAREYGVTVDGVDASAINIDHASAAAGQSAAMRFHHAAAEALPFPDSSFDAVVCECAFCTFSDKAAAAREFARILKPGGRLGITDVSVTEEGLPNELTTLAAWVACIADARSVSGYAAIFATAGLMVSHVESHDDALLRMIDRIEARLTAAHITAPQLLVDSGVDHDAVRRYTALVREAVHGGNIGYTLIVASKS
jgi:SAM-dependent methyltransferase